MKGGTGTALRHLAGRVWLWPHDEDPAAVQGCVGVVVDDAGSLLVDAGNSPAAAACGRHSDDSTIVAVPDSGVVLLGDCFYPPPLHLRAPSDDLDLDLLSSLVQEYATYEWFVDSHDAPRSRAEVSELLATGCA